MIQVFSWNVNGIRAVHKKGFLDFIKNYQPDVLCLQETKATQEQVPVEILELEGYHQFYESAQKKGYSGVALFSKEKPLEVTTTFTQERFNNEGRIQRARFQDYILYNIYFPNGGASEERLQYKLDFYDHFLEELKPQMSEPILVCGDLNTAHHPIDLKNDKANVKTSGFLPIERAWMDRLVEFGFVDTFRKFYPEEEKYSWWSYRMGARKRNVGWRLDYHFVNEALLSKVKGSEILNEVEGSDHCPVMVQLDI